jgi:cytoskeleton protein RodZ
MTLGAYLKSEREARGIALEKISRETKLGMRILEAIEKDRFDLLPGGMFRNAFIKSYARQIGLDGEKVLHDFHLVAIPPASPLNVENVRGLPLENKGRLKTFIGFGLGATIVVGLIGFLILRENDRKIPPAVNPETLEAGKAPSRIGEAQGRGEAKGEPKSRPLEIQPSGNAIPATSAPPLNPPSAPLANNSQRNVLKGAPSPAGAPAGPPLGGSPTNNSARSELKVLGELAQKPEAPPEPSSESGIPSKTGGLRLYLTTTEKTWISVMSGEKTIFTGLLEAGSVKFFSLNYPLKMTIGNAGGVLLSVNKQNFRPLGASGEVRVILVTAENFQQYLMSPQT